MAPGGTPAIDLVRRAGTLHRVHEYALPERHGRARAGRRGLQLELTPADLVRLTTATLAPIIRSGEISRA